MTIDPILIIYTRVNLHTVLSSVFMAAQTRTKLQGRLQGMSVVTLVSNELVKLPKTLEGSMPIMLGFLIMTLSHTLELICTIT